MLSSTAESFEPFAQNVLTNMQSFMEPEKAQNPADYSTEYLTAMAETFA